MQLDLRDKVFIEYNVRQVYSIPAEYQGRVGALRCKRGDVDFWFLVVYSQGRTEAERLRVSGLWRYVVSLVSALPHRCVQVLFTDCNGKNGLHRDADGVCLPIEAPVIGGCTAELENSNGTIFRECLEEQFLCSVHSHLAPGHTYFGNIAGVRSRIDHVCLQHAMLHTVVFLCGFVFFGCAATTNQRTWETRSHTSQHVFSASLQFSRVYSQSGYSTWDMSSLANGVLRGDGRHRPCLSC